MKRILAAFALMITPAQAQENIEPLCGELGSILQYLLEDFGEMPVASAIRQDGLAMIITTSSNGSWSEVLVSPSGRACIDSFGQDFGINLPEAKGVDM